MWINLKRFTSGALLLASLSLLLSGCGDLAGTPKATVPDTKPITGVVSDPDTGLPLANAKVTAYAIDDAGVQAAAPLSVNPASVTSGTDGGYALRIPKSYSGSVMIEAEPSSLIGKLAKLVFATTGKPNTIRSAISKKLIAQESIPPVMVSFATNAVVVFIEKNSAATGGLSSDNIQKAAIVMETFFGPNFSQTPPPKSASDSTKAQQDLLVSIRAINVAINDSVNTASPITIEKIVTSIVTTGLGGQDDIAVSITRAITTVTAILTTGADSILPHEYVPSEAINTAISNAATTPVVLPTLIDTTPTVPEGLAATAENARTVSLAWTASTDSGTGIEGYSIYRAKGSADYALIDTVGKDAATYKDVTVAPATTYSFKIRAFNKSRIPSEFSSPASASTPSVITTDTAPPTAPAGLVCIGFNDSQVNLKWAPSTKRNSDSVDEPAAGYNVYRNSQLIATVTGGNTSYTDSTVLANSDYAYYVKAFDANFNLSQASDQLNVRTAAPAGVTPPAAPAGLALQSGAAYNKVALSWNASATANVTYNVYRGADLIARGLVATQYSDSTVTPNSACVYTVTASGATGESSPSNQLSVQVPPNPLVSDTAPTAPTNLVLVAPPTYNSVALTWAASTKSDGDRIVAGYDVLRAEGTGSYAVIATVRLPGYTDTSVSASSPYSYQVRSFSTGGSRSAAGNTVPITTPAPVDVSDTIPPTAPASLALMAPATSYAVALTWSASTKATGDRVVAGYYVYRNGAQIADVTGVGHIDQTVAPTTSYQYTVKAYDNPGNISAAGNVLSVTTPEATIPTYTISGKVTVNGIGLSGVLVSISGSGTGGFITDANGTYTASGLLNGSYVITPSRAGFEFTPASRTVSIAGASKTGQDFTAVQTGTVTGGVTYPGGSVSGGVTYPGGSVTGGVTYPPGTIIGGITYPSGVVIGGVTYPTATVIGGVTYPTGVVIGGITYPSGVVIGGVTYPPGTVVGGVAFPVGAVIGGVTYPSGVVIGGVTYPNGTVTGGVIYPSGTVIGGVTYPSATVIGGVTYPSGTLIGQVSYPSGTVIGGVIYPSGSVIGAVAYPDGSVVGAVTYPTGSISGELNWVTAP